MAAAKTTKTPKKEIIRYYGLGRRKSSVARVYILPGSGKFTINFKEAKQYLNSDILIKDALSPFEVTGTSNTFDVIANVNGGGLTGQAGAIRLGIARALLEASNNDYHNKLKDAGFLTRDARVKERKKYGLRKARRARQFSKR
ncbi:30S ribosomal protein S9 [Metamycoplasma hyosynoviae]|uniref:Small ribosomal subunit protein uS9 n=1 Tax=Metamycoplasma hyosynoviae TaxID=29559 RepID=A0A4R7TYN8_9BACT|nr:30S ribosomal protein S9 [Metamycoplasma hyosynoviae]MDC8901046.1 30S ribosomal protein S9 [Metamycoplasma hyosynoviae]MDC8911677.1 30S ribosomal protein S9 [Metamycoplasma hyosynoviae]MDC8912606.1 30S ribosomal protein S9 [Metamycoplasma hyosynoviae]MDC8913160.1 30S ribosomal protein S9 [Metamycoplasma hyosynoviae]MDC8914468.1 30S ribosomal protein S9 [Metamycoplasma hyosynoviae]